MRAITGSGDAIGDLVWEGSRHGEKGWATGAAGTRAGAPVQKIMMWGDAVCQHFKICTDLNWTQLVRAGKVPASLIGFDQGVNNKPGQISGGYWAGFGGQSSTRMYAAIQDRVIRSDDGDTFADTVVVNYPIYSNEGVQRVYGPKGATDDVNIDVFYIGMGGAKLIVSLDGGVTKTQPASLPAPTAPSDALARYTVVAVDEGSTMTGGGTSRRSRIAASPSGQGVWLSTDGGVTFANITGGSGIISVSNLTWINGILFACQVGAEGPLYTGADKLKKYDPTNPGAGWVDIAHGMSLNGDYIQFIVADPRYANGYWAFTSGGNAIHTQNGTTFVSFLEIGGTYPNQHHIYCQTKPQERPLVAQSYRYDALGGAISCGVTCNGKLYIPIGFGVLSTPVANFPLAATDYNTPFGSGWPVWTEETAGIEEIVGQNGEWIYNTVDNIWEFWCGGQDVALARFETGFRGHKPTIAKYPRQRSDSHSIMRGMVPGYAVCRRTREDNAVPAFTYTTNGKDWQKCANQPAQPDSAVYECGCGVAMGAGKALLFPTRIPQVPMCTADLGATPWQEIDFYIGSTKLAMTAWKNPANAGVAYNGFQGSNFSNQHHNACLDPTTGDAYCVNIGATDNEGVSSWVQQPDPKGWAGIYKMAANEFGVMRRVHAGHPAFVSNFAYFDCKLVADGAGHLAFISNYLPGSTPNAAAAATANTPVIYNIAGNTLTPITTVWNLQGIGWGAPYPADEIANGGDGRKCLWMLGWGAGGWGIYYSRDLGATVKGPYAVPSGGYLGYIAPHPVEWGVLGGPRIANGHAIGRFQLKV